jgi:hypothetical protein
MVYSWYLKIGRWNIKRITLMISRSKLGIKRVLFYKNRFLIFKKNVELINQMNSEIYGGDDVEFALN